MRILIVGNVNSYLLLRLAEKIRKNSPDWTIDALTFEPKPNSEALQVFDTIHFLEKENHLENVRGIKFFLLLLRMRKILRNLKGNYDTLAILYLSSVYRFFWRSFRRKADKVVIVMFGSDFYRSSGLIRRLNRKMLKEADVVSVTNPKLLDDLGHYYRFLKKKEGKVVRFGLSILDAIDNVSDELKKQFREQYNIPDDAIIVACGYNASRNQCIEEIISSVHSVKKKCRNIVLFFQFHIGADSKYIHSLLKLIEHSGFDYRVIHTFLSEEQLAIYRCSADYMIQVQETDQLSGAMQEFLYAGSTVITGKWLPYDIFLEYGIQFETVENRTQIGPRLVQLMSVVKEKNPRNREGIARLSKWNHTINDWLKLLT